jgi:glycosyltransferase involved in cell wall biosynthesis
MAGNYDLSIAIPCYNEEKVLGLTMPPLAEAFETARVRLQLILVNNGSKDRTSDVIDRLIEQGLPVTKGEVAQNRGQGLGFLTGFQMAEGRFVCNLCADGQVQPADVLRIYQAAVNAPVPSIAKARRRFRQDSWTRKIISIIYNGMMLIIFPGIHTLDVNGNPKILPTDSLKQMEITSTDWFVEAEIMLKAREMKLPVIEVDVPGQLRQAGRSHVRAEALIEFLKNIWRYRFGTALRDWRKRCKTQAHSAHAPYTKES